MSKLNATVAWLALFFSLAGTGLAASRYIITSTSQIKPSVRRALRGEQGAPGAQGPTGASGVAGPTGGEANLARLCAAIQLAATEADHASKEVNLETEAGRLRSFSYVTVETALGGVYIAGCG